MGKNNNELIKMMGMMAICCLIPIVLLGVVGTAGGVSPMVVIGIVALCVLMHLFMMRNHATGKKKEQGVDEKAPDKNSQGGSCH